ncbi:MAG: NAD-dependent epimerase/dehydratase family protein [Flavobacteriaceae bacterium]|nr:NAD-dependent epimerase/dehydratase family protein [Flavobacteriaceae bacterium]
MHTILGANGQIAKELTKELYHNYSKNIRLVSRDPKKVHESDQLYPANLMDYEATQKAVKGSEIAYLTVGLPIDSKIWEVKFPVMMKNVIMACKKYDCKLVFFDNTYMYAKTNIPQTEESPFEPVGRKSKVRAQITEMLLKEIQNKSIQAVICRAPEFYGPNKTQSITNTLIFDNIAKKAKPKVPLRDDTKRTLIWTPDASRAMALIGNTPDCYSQTWHLPCDSSRPTYREIMDMASEVYGRELKYTILKMWQFKIGRFFNKQVKELQELLPRYKYDNIFKFDKFEQKFPSFKTTTFREGIIQLKNEQNAIS